MKFMENRLWLLVSYSDRTDFLQIFADELEDEWKAPDPLDRMIMFPEATRISIHEQRHGDV